MKAGKITFILLSVIVGFSFISCSPEVKNSSTSVDTTPKNYRIKKETVNNYGTFDTENDKYIYSSSDYYEYIYENDVLVKKDYSNSKGSKHCYNYTYVYDDNDSLKSVTYTQDDIFEWRKTYIYYPSGRLRQISVQGKYGIEDLYYQEFNDNKNNYLYREHGYYHQNQFLNIYSDWNEYGNPLKIVYSMSKDSVVRPTEYAPIYNYDENGNITFSQNTTILETPWISRDKFYYSYDSNNNLIKIERYRILKKEYSLYKEWLYEYETY